MAIDSRGAIHVVWTESNKGSWGLYYTRSSDGGSTWSTRIALDGDNFVWWYRMDLEVDQQDQLHVVWEVTSSDLLGVTRGVVYARSADGGKTWTHSTFPHNLPPYPEYTKRDPGPQQPSIGIDGTGNVLLVFRDPITTQIMYQVSPDGTHWSTPTTIPGITAGVVRPYDMYQMITDSAGRVHLVLVGYPTEPPAMSLLHTEWNGGSWSRSSVIAGSPPYPEYPKLAISGGNRLHLVWFSGDRATVDRNYVGIWYSTALTDAPRRLRQSMPESARPAAAVQSETELPSVSGTPSAVPTEERKGARQQTMVSTPALPISFPPTVVGPALALLVLVAVLLARHARRAILVSRASSRIH